VNELEQNVRSDARSSPGGAIDAMCSNLPEGEISSAIWRSRSQGRLVCLGCLLIDEKIMRSKFFSLLACLTIVLANSSASAADPRVADLVKAEKLRIGVFPSFQFSRDAAGKPRGLAFDISNAMSKQLGIAEVVVIEHPTPPQVIACVKSGDCDLAFMLIDPVRAAEVNFTPAFVRSDFTYLVPPGSPLRSAADVDRPGIRVAAVRGHASTIALVRLLKHAEPVYAGTYDPTFDLLRSGNADAFASIREMLIQYSTRLPGSRVLDDSYQTNLAGIAVPKEKAERLDGLKHSGSLKKMLDDNGLRGVEVATSQ
jgi:polar amino acid transport system substrate-binding protein